MNVTDDDLQRAIEESMRAENRRREQSFSTPGLNDSVDDALMAKALEESLAMEGHRMGAAKTSNEEDKFLKLAIEQSRRESEQNDNNNSGSSSKTSSTTRTSTNNNRSYASAVGRNQNNNSNNNSSNKSNVRKRDQLLPPPDDDEDPLLMAAIQASMTQDQQELARKSKAENRKAKKKMKKNERRRSGSGNKSYNTDFNFPTNPNPTNFERRRMSNNNKKHSNGSRSNNDFVDLTSGEGGSSSNKKSSSSSFAEQVSSLRNMKVKEMKDELRRLKVPFSDCITRQDLESRLVLARDAMGDDYNSTGSSYRNKRRGNSFSSLDGGSGSSSGGGSVKSKTSRKPKVDPKFLEEAQQAAELVEREDLLSVLPNEIRNKAEVLYAEAMEQYRRIFSTRNGSRLVKKPHIRDCISKARYQVQNEQRARMDEARRKQKEEEKRIQEVVEQAEREEQLSALPDNVRIEAEMLFANMMSEFQQVGGRMPRMDYAISIATDKVKEQQRSREEELRKIEEEKVAEERRIKEAEEAKIQAQKEAEEKVIQARNNESRSARAARFAAAYEKRMAASKNNGGGSGNSKNDENNQEQISKRK